METALADWDTQPLSQKSVPYTKRLQLLYRIKILIKKFKSDQKSNHVEKDQRNWENLLNFLPNNLLYGQKPSVWWTKRHDTDLLRGVYKYGYANYATIRYAKEYCFKELEKSIQAVSSRGQAGGPMACILPLSLSDRHSKIACNSLLRHSPGRTRSPAGIWLHASG